jgi:hypothetical protein
MLSDASKQEPLVDVSTTVGDSDNGFQRESQDVERFSLITTTKLITIRDVTKRWTTGSTLGLEYPS